MTTKRFRKHSSKVVDGIQQSPSRAMLRAVGFKDSDFLDAISNYRIRERRYGMISEQIIK